MGNRLYIGNLSYRTTEQELRDAFKASGEITDIKVMTDRETGESRGFAFVTFATPEQATTAIQDWNGADLGGRRLKVNEAEDRKPRQDRGQRLGTVSYGGDGERRGGDRRDGGYGRSRF